MTRPSFLPPPPDSERSLNAAIVGGGRACAFILNMVRDGTLDRLKLKVLGVADVRDNPPGIQLARELGLDMVTDDYRKLYDLPDLDLLIELTGRREIRDDLERSRPPHVSLIDHVGARLFWELHQAESAVIHHRTEKRRTVEAERLRIAQIFDSIPDEIVVLDGDMVIQDANAAYLDNNAHTIGQVLGCRCYEVDQEVRGECQVAVENCPFFMAMEEKKPGSIVRKHFDSEGNVRYAAIVAAPIVDQDGEVSGVVEMTRDITSRILLEEELKATEVQLRQFLDHAPIAAYVKNRQAQYVEVNPAICSLFGKPKSEIIAKTDLEILPRSAAEQLRAGDRDVVEKRQEVTFDTEADLPNGHVFLSTIKYPILGPDGRVSAIGGLLKDVTAQHDAEAELARTREYLQDILDYSPVMIITTDLDNNVVSFNRCAEETLGYAAQEVIGAPAAQLYRDPEERSSILRRVKQDGAVREYETVLLHKDGTEVPASITLTQLQDVTGKMIGTVGASRDISTRKSLMNQIIQSERLAAVGRLAAGVAHEINNPLAVISEISGFLNDLIEDPDEVDPDELVRELEEWLPKLTKQVKRGRNVTYRMLRFARKSEAETELVDVNKAIDEVVPFLNKEANLAGVTIHRDFDDELPNVRVEEMQLQEIALNLMTNAIQAMRARGHGNIWLATRSDKGKVMISVRDDGPGIDEEVQDRLFDPFVTTKPPGQGTGLGLSICYGVVKRYDGEIRVESTPGQGSTFTVVLPAWHPPHSVRADS
ncbi:MAG: PAS domain-containing protein [Deltaproteobacteria bacterium]|jgi:PAS domain S-box-containing protein|nr:PAS domain-containing protein [Deltaproteobacteria bacterium]MBW2536228.1 PAS domain-containing protein [Deltaproteobacteria bacterium]